MCDIQNRLVTFDRINLILPKLRKAEIKSHASSHKESVNGYIKKAIAIKPKICYIIDTKKATAHKGLTS